MTEGLDLERAFLCVTRRTRKWNVRMYVLTGVLYFFASWHMLTSVFYGEYHRGVSDFDSSPCETCEYILP